MKFSEINIPINWAWWYMSVIPALKRLRQEDQRFKAILDYIASLRPTGIHSKILF
jgi:hypothetical protein